MVLADIPGLIDGASEGAGLGTRFLGHVERCSVLMHLIDATEIDVVASYHTVRRELESYGADLSTKIEIIALNKCDSLTDEEIEIQKIDLEEDTGASVLVISGIAGTGVKEMLNDVFAAVEKQRLATEEDSEERRVYRP